MPATSLSDTYASTLAPSLKWLGYQKIADLSTAQTLSPPDGAIQALIQCKDGAIRWRCDATAPVAGTGATLAFTATGTNDWTVTTESGAEAINNVTGDLSIAAGDLTGMEISRVAASPS